MFTGTTTTTEYSNPIGIMPLVTRWKYNNAAELAPNCPRCASSNTKFCYYNNYSLSQPRYFCKGCRRYWTKGGSLRNVPVGGGCRKSRRARAARQNSGPGYPSPRYSPADAGPADEPGGGAHIDMAAVFARYVGPNVEIEESSSPGASSGSSDNAQARSLQVDGQLDDITMFEYQKPLEYINGGDDLTQQVIPQFSTCQDITGREFLHQDFELQQDAVLGNELDVLWSEGTLPSSGYQQEVQDLGLFSSDDQLRISAENLLEDNWGSFDLSAYDFYSTP